jgi:hypothetical protein
MQIVLILWLVSNLLILLDLEFWYGSKPIPLGFSVAG